MIILLEAEYMREQRFKLILRNFIRLQLRIQEKVGGTVDGPYFPQDVSSFTYSMNFGRNQNNLDMRFYLLNCTGGNANLGRQFDTSYASFRYHYFCNPCGINSFFPICNEKLSEHCGAYEGDAFLRTILLSVFREIRVTEHNISDRLVYFLDDGREDSGRPV